MEYVLQTDALCKHYGDFKALNGLSMHIPKGAIYGFVGKNGAGKTTLLRIICGLQPPTSGNYTLYDKKHTAPDFILSRRRIGAMVETPSIYPDMSAEDNLKQQYLILGQPSFFGLHDILKMVGLENTGHKRAKHFSLGMRQRLGIAIALVGNPDFLILDEPINGLDPQGIVEIRELLLKLNREQQITILISSHILSELSRLATHYGFIDHGELLREMSAEELEEACKKCIRMQVSDASILARTLDEMQISYRVLNHTCVDVYAKINCTQLVNALYDAGCEVISMEERDESLESFYLNLVGGGRYE